MANAFYSSFLAGALKGEIDLLTDDIKVTIVDTADYTFAATDDFYSAIPAAARVGESGNLANKSVSDATPSVFDADDITINSVTGDTSEAVVVWKDTGVEATSQLIAYFDTDGGGAIEIIPNGGNITIQWNASGILSIG
jgi:hypothetical protein